MRRLPTSDGGVVVFCSPTRDDVSPSAFATPRSIMTGTWRNLDQGSSPTAVNIFEWAGGPVLYRHDAPAIGSDSRLAGRRGPTRWRVVLVFLAVGWLQRCSHQWGRAPLENYVGPQWRGANRDGRVPRLPQTMPALKLLWQQKVAGRCDAGISIVSGLLVMADFFQFSAGRRR